MAFPLRILASLLPAAAVVVMFPGQAAAQSLSQALWQESISLDVQTVETHIGSFTGSDLFAPEPHTEELTGTGFSVTGTVGFSSAGPPVGTAQVGWAISEAGAALQLLSNVSISFQVRVVETGTPPVAVTEVPVHLLATGSTTVEEIFGSRATSGFVFRVLGTEVVIVENLDISGDPEGTDPPTDSFTIDETPSIPVDTIVLVSMTATASMGTVGTGGATTGSSTVGEERGFGE